MSFTKHENYGTKAMQQIAEAFKNGQPSKSHNAMTDGKTITIHGLTIAEKRDDGMVYLTTAHYAAPILLRYLQAVANAFVPGNWTGYLNDSQAMLELKKQQNGMWVTKEQFKIGPHLKPFASWKRGAKKGHARAVVRATKGHEHRVH